MAFGPLCNEADRAPSGPLAAAEVTALVRAAANGLVADLRAARSASADWSEPQRAAALVDNALARCLTRLARSGLWGRDNEAPSNELWNIAGESLQTGALQHRARLKPRGYAGDYVMLAQICDGFVCEHPLGRHFDRYFQCQVAPQAVRARTEQIGATAVAHCLAGDAQVYRIVSVGAGPARDVEHALRLLPPGARAAVRVRLLDLDDEALDFARRRLEPLLRPDQLEVVRENLFRLHRPGRAELLDAPVDFLICPGLFDYLDDPPAAALLGWFWQRLAPAGMLLVGNFAPHCATRAYMEWIGNWYLHYRTPRAFAQLAQRARIPDDRWTIGVERFGVDLFLQAVKDGE